MNLKKKKNLSQELKKFVKVREKNVKIFIDAEESWIQNAIDDMTLNMMRKFNKKNVGYTTLFRCIDMTG